MKTPTFFGENTPGTEVKDIASLVMDYIHPTKKHIMGLVSKNWHEVFKNDFFWKDIGANSYEDFINRIENIDPRLVNLICDGFYNLPFAEEIQNLWEMTTEERLNALFTEDEASNLHHLHLEHLLSENGVQALREGLISIDEASNLHHLHLEHLLSENGVQALREGLISIDEASNLYHSQLRHLLSENGVQALREGLISIDEASNLHHLRLEHLLSENGVQALREGLISIDEASNLHHLQLGRLLSERIEQNNIEKPSHGI